MAFIPSPNWNYCNGKNAKLPNRLFFMTATDQPFCRRHDIILAQASAQCLLGKELLAQSRKAAKLFCSVLINHEAISLPAAPSRGFNEARPAGRLCALAPLPTGLCERETKKSKLNDIQQTLAPVLVLKSINTCCNKSVLPPPPQQRLHRG